MSAMDLDFDDDLAGAEELKYAGAGSEFAAADHHEASGGGGGALVQVQVRFEPYTQPGAPAPRELVPAVPLAVPVSLGPKQLSEVLNVLAQQDPPRTYDFLIGEEFLRSTLDAFLKQRQLSGEDVVVLRYLEGLSEPQRRPDQNHPDWVSGVDGRLQGLVVSGCYDGVLRLVFDPEAGAGEAESPAADRTLLAAGHVGPIRAITVLNRSQHNEEQPWAQAAHSLTLSGGKDSVIRVWQLQKNAAAAAAPAKGKKSSRQKKQKQPELPFAELRTVAVARGHTDTVLALAGLPAAADQPQPEDPASLSGRFASGGWDRRVLLWDLRRTKSAAEAGDGADSDQEGGEDDDEEDVERQSQRRRLNDSKPQKKHKAGRAADRFADLPKLQPVALLQGHTGAVSALCWPHPNAVYSGSWDHSIRQWDTQTGALVNSWTGNKVITSMKFNIARNLLATSHHDSRIRLWDPRKQGQNVIKLTLSSHKAWVSDVAWNPANPHLLASASYDGTVKVWDIRSTEPLLSLEAHAGEKALCVDWHGAGELVSGGADRKLARHVLHGEAATAVVMELND